jgi:hypothetical protein
MTGGIMVINPGCTNFRVAPQLLDGDNVVIFTEGGVVSSSTVALAQAHYEHDREIPTTTSNSVYTTLYKVTLPSFSATKLALTITGNLASVGAMFYDGVVTLSRGNGGNVTATVVGTPTTIAIFDVNYDVTTVAGECAIQIRRNGANGTQINGRCHVAFDGIVQTLKKGA